MAKRNQQDGGEKLHPKTNSNIKEVNKKSINLNLVLCPVYTVFCFNIGRWDVHDLDVPGIWDYNNNNK